MGTNNKHEPQHSQTFRHIFVRIGHKTKSYKIEKHPNDWSRS